MAQSDISIVGSDTSLGRSAIDTATAASISTYDRAAAGDFAALVDPMGGDIHPSMSAPGPGYR